MKTKKLTCLLAGIFAVSTVSADEIPIGVLSFDVFIPASTTPGVNAFDIFNYSGPTYGPTLGTPYVTTPVSFDNATLTLYMASGSSQVIDLGNLVPGELLDSSGNPVVQVPSTENFTSAALTATLSAAILRLSNGATLTVSPTFTADLTPSSGSLLVAGVDLVTIDAKSSISAVPEAATFGLASLALLVFLGGIALRQAISRF